MSSNRNTLFPSIEMQNISRRSDESLTDFERAFNVRVMEIFTENRRMNLEDFKVDTANFLKALRVEFIWGESGQTMYLTVTRLMRILKTSPQTIKDLLPHSIISTLVRITNFNMTIDISLIEHLVNSIIHAEDIYIKLLPYAENSTEISSYKLQDFVVAHYVPMMIEEPERTDYYSAYAVGIIFFLLDARRREYVFIKDLLSSTLLMHLENCIRAENDSLPLPEIDVYKRFSGYFNAIFLQRIFDISMTYENGFLDFKAFVDLMTAIRFRNTHASAKYHFEALDLKNDGILDEDEIRTTAQVLPEYVPDDNNVNIDIVTAELKDMLGLKTSGVDSEEFLANRMNSTFSGFLSNYADYLKYERREQ
ncbi:hypothetical protein CAEBREN_30625 [Caenorhabditis brenneri]|uniref:EF-hand domain-containing protein n=1 Tax=Caenorhabditis brenneri TaxID=135651 RepID=G0P4X9_CAEBE|nr:hypothetical protein CAEBREN_30625 [Caenorhabditis brenneri]